MAGEIQHIIDKLVTIQQGITQPTGEKALTSAHDEPPADINAFPCFVNVEQEIPGIDRRAGGRRYNLVIDMHLLLTSADQKYSVRTRRLWLQPVLDAFDAALKLGNEQLPVQIAPITRISFDPIEINNTYYIGITFRLEALVIEAHDFGV